MGHQINDASPPERITHTVKESLSPRGRRTLPVTTPPTNAVHRELTTPLHPHKTQSPSTRPSTTTRIPCYNAYNAPQTRKPRHDPTSHTNEWRIPLLPRLYRR